MIMFIVQFKFVLLKRKLFKVEDMFMFIGLFRPKRLYFSTLLSILC